MLFNYCKLKLFNGINLAENGRRKHFNELNNEELTMPLNKDFKDSSSDGFGEKLRILSSEDLISAKRPKTYVSHLLPLYFFRSDLFCDLCCFVLV